MNRYDGGIALSTIIMFTYILSIGATTLALTSIDITKATKEYSLYTQARLSAQSCLEESINTLKFNDTYTGTINLSVNGTTCDAVITDTATSGIKNADISSDYGDTSYLRSYEIDVNNLPIIVTPL